MCWAECVNGSLQDSIMNLENYKNELKQALLQILSSQTKNYFTISDYACE